MLRNFDELFARRTMQSVQSLVFVHLHHTAAGTLHFHATATSRRARCRRTDSRDRIFHIDRSGMVEFQRRLDCLALFERMVYSELISARGECYLHWASSYRIWACPLVTASKGADRWQR